MTRRSKPKLNPRTLERRVRLYGSGQIVGFDGFDFRSFRTDYFFCMNALSLPQSLHEKMLSFTPTTPNVGIWLITYWF